MLKKLLSAFYRPETPGVNAAGEVPQSLKRTLCQSGPYEPSKLDLRIGDVVAMYTRKEGEEDAFHVGTVLAISKEKLRVQYWQCTRCDGMWSKSSLRRMGSSFASARNLDMKVHTGIIWAEDGVIDKIPSLQGKSRGTIDTAHLEYIRKEAKRYRQKSMQTLKGDLRSFKTSLLRGKAEAGSSSGSGSGEDGAVPQAERKLRRLVSGAISFISVRSSSFSSHSSESSGVEASLSDSAADSPCKESNLRLKRLTTV